MSYLEEFKCARWIGEDLVSRAADLRYQHEPQNLFRWPLLAGAYANCPASDRPPAAPGAELGTGRPSAPAGRLKDGFTSHPP